jgi:hypothetical protein
MMGGKKVAIAGSITMYEGLMAAVCSSPSDKGENEEGFSNKRKNSSMEVTSLGTHTEEMKQQQSHNGTTNGSARKRAPG